VFLNLAAWWRYLASPHRSPETFYDLNGDHLLSADGSMPLANMGYWAGIESSAPDRLERANLALFDLAIDAANLGAGARVLDIGSGFGGCAIRIAERIAGSHVTGVNLSRVQLATSQRLVQRAGLHDRIAFTRADARRLPFDSASFDAVVCVEAAFHFERRADCLAEAARVLRPGGRLSLVDLLPLPARGFRDRLAWRFTGRGLAIPPDNVMLPAAYRSQIEQSGFEIATFRSIVAQVYPSFRRWQLSRPLRHLLRVPPLMAASTAGFLFYPWDYVQLVGIRSGD
jgi:cyclopropane fatty-acyl-phospholipid synthase-like methyltransferase